MGSLRIALRASRGARPRRPLKRIWPMSFETMRQITEMIEWRAHSRPSPIEFDIAYQARIAIDCIRFAIKHAEQSRSPAIGRVRRVCICWRRWTGLNARTGGFRPARNEGNAGLEWSIRRSHMSISTALPQICPYTPSPLPQVSNDRPCLWSIKKAAEYLGRTEKAVRRLYERPIVPPLISETSSRGLPDRAGRVSSGATMPSGR
jgi:hypothetical protein